MKQTASEFDKEYEKEQRKKVLLIGSGIAVFLAFCMLILYLALPENMPGTENVQGIITSATTVDTATGKSPAMIVTLNNGEEITILAKDGLTFRQGAEITLKKLTSTAGIDSYHFIRYAEQ